MRNIIFVLLFVVVSCSTITRGTQDTLVINSKPAGASFKIKEGEKVLFQGLIPSVFKLKRKGNYIVLIEKKVMSHLL
jgi:hypothetical protein